MSNKNNLVDSNFKKNDGFVRKQDNEALHQLTRQAEQALRAQQNNQNTEVKPEEPQE
ncbi:MAG: hypothetical protein Q8Q54_17500 [Methylococcales bacterium]|nr:hypothetical protein [Methylococcales bacterium]MDP3010514.1 hypothetical protein [Methylococcales bacterium]MDP3840714.1 hypothetical protein [Methylococcales bacterium]